MSKSTDDLRAELNQITDLNKYLKDNQENLVIPDPITYLLEICQAKGLSKSQLIHNSQLERTYGYHLLGHSKNLTRDKALALCFGAQLSPEEANNLLKYAQLQELYARDPRDSVLIYSLQKQNSLQETNLLLEELKLKCIE